MGGKFIQVVVQMKGSQAQAVKRLELYMQGGRFRSPQGSFYFSR